MRRISVELIATEREMVGTLDFPSAGRSLMTDREQMNWKCAKHSYTMQATPVLIFSSLSGSSESIMPDEWFQILWYCCDQSQKVLRWDGQKRKKNILFEVMVSMTIPNNKIQSWIQFKTSHSYLQGHLKVRPSPPYHPDDSIHPTSSDPLTNDVVYPMVILKETE